VKRVDLRDQLAGLTTLEFPRRTMSPSAWTMSAVEAAIFFTIVLGLAGAGTLASIG